MEVTAFFVCCFVPSFFVIAFSELETLSLGVYLALGGFFGWKVLVGFVFGGSVDWEE